MTQRKMMKKILTQTYLSKKITKESFLVGFISLMLLVLSFGILEKSYSASGHLVFQEQQYWRAFTTSLLHADFNHLASNAFFFAGLASLLYNYFGFCAFPVLSLFMGGLINIATLLFYPPEIHLVGVSGVIYFMASYWLTLYILIERRQKISTRIIHAIAVSLIFFFPHVFEVRTSYLAHGFGYLFGIPTGIIYYLLFRKKIRSQDVWMITEPDPEEEIIGLDPSPFHPETPEDASPSERACDSSQSRWH